MAYTKAKIYNLALSALLLSREVANTDTDKSNEVRILNLHWDTAFESTLEDLDLDSTASVQQLELIEELTEGPWRYVYKYPSKCTFLRRIYSGAVVDNRYTHISKQIGVHDGQKAIYTNQYDASASYIPNDVPLVSLSPKAALAIAYQLAILAAPLATGKGATSLIEKIEKKYAIAKAEAQEKDARENFNYEEDSIRSEFVAERMS